MEFYHSNLACLACIFAPKTPVFHSFPKFCNSSEVAFSITISMWRVPNVMGTWLLYALSFWITTNIFSLSTFTPGTWKFTSMYPKYGTSIPPDPSISNNCHSCLHGKPNCICKTFWNWWNVGSLNLSTLLLCTTINFDLGLINPPY